MPRHFNVAGPCKIGLHYMLPAMRRLPTVRSIIDQQGYFVVHAPRQVGKTTALQTLAQELTGEGRYIAVLLSMEVGSPFPRELDQATRAILGSWRRAARRQLPPALCPPTWSAEASIGDALDEWARAAPRPLVLFLDEIDSLQDQALMSVLRQLRDGFVGRPESFPWSLALIGMRDVRDYKIAAGGNERLHGASPFNIKVASLTLRNFTRAEVAELYQQHTDDTGQVFLPAAVDRAFYLTQGQPWLVNALAKELVEVLVCDVTKPIGAEQVDVAKESLILRQDTHLDSLAERLREPRVRHIIEPMLAGEIYGDVPSDDLRYLEDLGLCRLGPGGKLLLANPIYQEVIPRVLANNVQLALPGSVHPTWLLPDGQLSPERLLAAFLAFWRQHAQALLAAAPYHEVAAQLVMMAFLHRVANGAGIIEREYAIGSGRMDLYLRYGNIAMAIELKVYRDGRPDPRAAGLEQLDQRLAALQPAAGWLVIFDQRSGQPPIAERTATEVATTANGRPVTVIRA